MENIVDVETSVGTWQIAKPKAGVRNRAMAKAETTNGQFKKTVLFQELLPKCINKRPESFDDTVPIVQVLDGLEIEDWDLLFEALWELLFGKDAEETEGASEEKKT